MHIYSLEDDHWDSGEDQVHDTAQRTSIKK